MAALPIGRTIDTTVTPGLEPGVQRLRAKMDCRVKPGNDDAADQNENS
jgi:hypothetical protein